MSNYPFSFNTKKEPPIVSVAEHYDLLIDEGNDPVIDPPVLSEYMNRWDGDLFLDLLELDSTKSVLEIGCGTGRLAVKVAPKVGLFTGIDISPKTVSVAKTHIHLENSRLVCGDFLKFSFKEKFDVIYSSLTFMHIENKQKSIEKISKLLNNNGICVISLDKTQNDFLDYSSRQIKIFPDNPDQILKLLRDFGFSETEKHETDFAYIIKAKYLNR